MWTTETVVAADPARCAHHVWVWESTGVSYGRPAGSSRPARIRCRHCYKVRTVSQGYIDRVIAGGRFT